MSSIVCGPLTETKRTRWLGQTDRATPGILLLALRLLNRPLGQDAGKVLFVLRAGAQVSGRIEPVRRVLRCLFRLGSRLESLLDRVRPDWSWPDVGEPDAPATVHLLGRYTDDRPVKEAAAEFDVLVRTVGDKKHDLSDYLVRRQRRREQVPEEIFGRDRSLVGHDLGIEDQGDGWVVAGGVCVRDDTTHGAHVAHLVVADLAGDLGQDGQLVLDHAGILDRHVA